MLNAAPSSAKQIHAAILKEDLQHIKELVRQGHELKVSHYLAALDTENPTLIAWMTDQGFGPHVIHIIPTATSIPLHIIFRVDALNHANLQKEAARSGQFHALKQILGRFPYLHKPTVTAAAKCGYIHILNWLKHESKTWIPGSHAVGGEPIEHGHLNVLKWAKQNDCLDLEHCPIIRDAKRYGICSALSLASRYNQLDILQWLHAEGYKNTINGFIFEQATIHGNLNMLQWAFETYCENFYDIRPLDYYVRLALENFQPHIAQWLVQQKNVTVSPISCDGPSYQSSYNAMQWLKRHSVVVWTDSQLQWLDAVENLFTSMHCCSTDVCNLIKTYV